MGVALVTGTSSGFGRGAAERLVRLGWTVIGTVRDPTRTPAPRGCATAALDLRDPESIAALAHDVMGEHGRLDALVSNGCYVDTWRELDEFARYIADRADPDDAAVDAIVAAAVVPGAPRRIPVGRHAPTWIRDQLEELAANDRAAEQFLAANAGLGI